MYPVCCNVWGNTICRTSIWSEWVWQVWVHMLYRHICACLGALGKRTKFQEKDIAQMLLKVTCTSEEQGSTITAETDSSLLPKDLLLGDDTLLEEIKFTDQASTPLLSSLQQAAILGEWWNTLETLLAAVRLGKGRIEGDRRDKQWEGGMNRRGKREVGEMCVWEGGHGKGGK